MRASFVGFVAEQVGAEFVDQPAVVGLESAVVHVQGG